MTDPQLQKGFLAAAGSGLFGGLAIVATRIAVQDFEPALVAAIRYSGAAAILLIIAAAYRNLKFDRRDFLPIAGLGLLYFCLHPILFTVSLRLIPAGEGALLITLSPLVALALGAVLGHERVTPMKLGGILLAISGVATPLFWHGFQQRSMEVWLGDGCMLGAAFITGVYSNLARPYLRRYSVLGVTALGMTIGSLGLIIVVGITGVSQPELSLSTLALAAYLAGPGCALVFFLLVFAMARIPPSGATVFITLNPVVAPLAAYLLLDEPLTLEVMAGIGLVISGIFLANVETIRLPPPKAASSSFLKS